MNQVVLLYEVVDGQNKLHSIHKSEESAWIEKRYEEHIRYNNNHFFTKIEEVLDCCEYIEVEEDWS